MTDRPESGFTVDTNPPLVEHRGDRLSVSGDDVLTRDLSSGRIHRRIRIGDNLASIEADNLDDAGEYEIVGRDALDTANPDDLCLRCFPKDPSVEPDSVIG